GCQWITRESDQPSLIRDLRAAAGAAPTLEIESRQPTPVSDPALCAAVRLGDQWAWHFQIFPGSPGVLMQLQAPPGASQTAGATADGSATGIEATAAGNQESLSDVVDHLNIDSLHTRLTQVILVDQTDIH